jgi:hypothetical protein
MKTARGMTLQSPMDDWVSLGDVHSYAGTELPTAPLDEIRHHALETCAGWSPTAW